VERTQLDFETDMSHDVTVEVDYGGSVTNEVFTIDVNDINDAPVLDATATLTLQAMVEDDLNPAGDTVANILVSDSLNSITDDDIGAVEGIAVYTVDDTNGAWEYSLDGSSWTAIGAVDTASALLLDPTAMIRFVPDADFSGTAGFFFHAWDQTQGSNGQLFDIRDSGGSTAFSSIASNEVTVTINPVNDAPVLASGQNPRFETITENDLDHPGETVSSVLAKLGNGITDIDANSSEGIAIFTNNSNGGDWQYSTDAGTSWQDFGTVSTANALLLRDTDLVRMNPNGTFGHLGNFGFRAWDQTVGTAGTKVDIPALGGTGGTSTFSTNTLSALITVSNINDDPFNAGVTPADVSVTEDISTTIDLSAIDLMDVDDNGLSMSVRLSTATGGIINIAAQTGITTAGNGTSQVTLTGTKTDLNSYLDNPNNISYLHSTADTFGDNADKIRVDVSDLGNSGNGGGSLVGFGFTNIDITPVNDSPVAINDATYTTDEDTTLNIITGGILDNDTDVDDPLAITLLTTTTNGTLTLNPDGTFKYVPNTDFFGTDTFTYQLEDPSGETSAIATATITVDSVNDAPLTGGFTEIWLADLTPLTLTGTHHYDENAGGQEAQILLDGQEYFHGVGVHPDLGVGIVEYDLNAAEMFSAIVGVNDTLTKHAEVIFSAYVNDVEVFNSGIVTNDTPPIPVSIDTSTGSVLRLEIDSRGFNIVDHAIWADAKLTGGPVQPSTVSVAETASNGTLVGTYIGSDFDTADTLSYSLSDDALGRFAIDANTGEITVADDSLLDYETITTHPITVRIDDGTTFTDHIVTIELSEVNEAATGTDATITIDEDTPHTFLASDFGFFDTEDDGFESVLIRSLPAAGTLTLDDGPLHKGSPVKVSDFANFVYTPDPNVSGAAFDSFDFSVRDSRHLFSPVFNTVTFDVASVNDAPDAVDDPVSTDEDIAVTGNVLDNDSDIEGDTLSVNATPLTEPTKGTVVLNTDGTVLLY